jgi:hypothetical protein
MVTELLEFIVNWRMGLIILLVFGFAPGALLRLVVLAFRRDDPRRSEMLAELHRVPRLERPVRTDWGAYRLCMLGRWSSPWPSWLTIPAQRHVDLWRQLAMEWPTAHSEHSDLTWLFLLTQPGTGEKIAGLERALTVIPRSQGGDDQ